MPKRIFIISGEESGDLHGSVLMRALKGLMPDIEIEGMGGEKMRQAGLRGLDSKALSVVGIVEVLEKLGGILKAYGELKRRLAGGRFDAVILIDFPDFNLKMAKAAKRLGIPVIYYISPQVWAWRRGRVKTIAKLVDKMLVVFPFEEKLYRDAGVDVAYVGHPLADIAGSDLTKDEARRALGIPVEGTVISLLPGSRSGEIRRILGLMVEAAALVEKGLERKVQFLLPAADSIDGGFLEGFLKGAPVDFRVLRGKMYEALRASDAAAVTSGTATLETALIGTPMVIVYRMSPASYVVAKLLVGIDDVGLPNIVAGKRVVPELIQGEATARNIADEIIEMLRPGKRDSIEKEYKAIRASLGGGGAADRAAREIFKLINQGRPVNGKSPVNA